MRCLQGTPPNRARQRFTHGDALGIPDFCSPPAPRWTPVWPDGRQCHASRLLSNLVTEGGRRPNMHASGRKQSRWAGAALGLAGAVTLLGGVAATKAGPNPV